MSSKNQKTCCNCNELFQPTRRSRKRQLYCQKPECRKASNRHSQQKWLSKPENRDYFRGEVNVRRVQQWRAKNPGYWRRSRSQPKQDALQDLNIPQVPKNTGILPSPVNPALQDLFASQPLIVIGLIAQLTAITLQDDLVSTCSNLLRIAQDLLSGGCNEQIRTAETKPNPAYSKTIQLARPAASP